MITLNESHLSDFFRAQCKDVCNDSPLLYWWPSLHFHQDNVVVQHQITQIGNLLEVGGKNAIVSSQVDALNTRQFLKIKICSSTKETHSVEPELGERRVVELKEPFANWDFAHISAALLFVSLSGGSVSVVVLKTKNEDLHFSKSTVAYL